MTGDVHAYVDQLARLLELVGVAIIIVGIVVAAVLFAYSGLTTKDWRPAYEECRSNLGRGILLGPGVAGRGGHHLDDYGPADRQSALTRILGGIVVKSPIGGALAALLKLRDAGLLDRQRFGRILFHIIEASPELEKIAASTKRNNSEPFLRYLFGLGRKTAEEWFARNGEAIGKSTTFDFEKLLPDEHWGDVSTFPS